MCHYVLQYLGVIVFSAYIYCSSLSLCVLILSWIALFQVEHFLGIKRKAEAGSSGIPKKPKTWYDVQWLKNWIFHLGIFYKSGKPLLPALWGERFCSCTEYCIEVKVAAGWSTFDISFELFCVNWFNTLFLIYSVSVGNI